MHYYVDGYNLLFHLKETDLQLKASREELIDDLCEKLSLVKIQVSIVFDASYQEGINSRGHKENLEIQYTDEGETADEFIIAELKVHLRKEQTVVTSDKKLAWLARCQGAKTTSVQQFIQWLNKAYDNKLRQVQNPIKTPEKCKPVIPPPMRPKIMTDEERWYKIFVDRSRYNLLRDDE
jgi:uncharacterized protein